MADAPAPAATFPFEIRHAVVIAARPEAVFDYVTNPKSWPEWLPSSHALECDDRPMGFGDTFHEHWSTRSGPVDLDWLVIACDRPLLWIGLTQTSFMGPVVVHYTFEAKDGGTHFTRILRNPARPKPPTAEMIERSGGGAGVGEYQEDCGAAVSRQAKRRATGSTRPNGR